jgi:RND superfamily putative drug exporter
MFTFLGRFTAAHPWKICIGWLVLGVGLSLIAPNWDSKAQDDDIHFLPARCDSVRGYQQLEKAFPQDVYASRAIVTVERSDQKLSEADFAFVDTIVADLERFKKDKPDLQIGRICSHDDPFIGKRLVSDDGKCTLIQVSLPTPFLAAQTQAVVDRLDGVLHERLKQSSPNVPKVLMSGPAGIGRDLNHAGSESLDVTTLATIILVVVILLVVYRAPLLALIPLVTIGISVWVALKLLALFTLVPGVYLVNVSRVFAIVLLYGAGTDYCLFLISRYREELMNGNTLPASISLSVRSVGAALAASAGTVICGLGLMGFAEFAKVRCAGPAIALSLAVALAASLTLTPALLHLMGRVVFWPRGMPRRQILPNKDDWWMAISRVVVTRPLAVWVASLALLLPLAFLGLRLKHNYRPTGELSQRCQSIQGLNAIQKHFVPGEIGPITVLLSSTTDWNSPEGRQLISLASRSFTHLDNVSEVRSLTQPLGQPLPEPGPQLPAHLRPPAKKGLFDSLSQAIKVDGLYGQADKIAREHFVSSIAPEDPEEAKIYVTRLDVVMKSDPFAPKSIETLGVVQAWLREEMPRAPTALTEVASECYGVTVNARDLAQVSEADRHRVNYLVLGAIFLILLVLVRHLWLAAYLLITVLISYFATLGATSLAGILFTGHPFTEVDWRVPFFLFTILVAVGEDYNILLMTRALKERRRHGNTEGMRRALARTGGTITSCGLIMAGTFATLMLAGLGTLIQAGFALAFGVLLDTFIVRPFLVPAFTVLVWQEEAPKAKEEDEEEEFPEYPNVFRRLARSRTEVTNPVRF